MKQKIGILTMHWANNYGGVLQCYALSSFLNSQGYDCEIVNYWPPYALKKRAAFLGSEIVVSEFGDAADKVIRDSTRRHTTTKNRDKCLNIDEFRNRYIRQSKSVTDERQLKLQLEKYDSVIVGSDQIWNPRITGGRFDDAYFLNFDIHGRRIAYAASTGIQIPEILQGRFLQLVNRFDSISAREISLSDYLQKNGRTAPCVLDPVFLLPPKNWESITDSDHINKQYILVYTLERNAELVKAANYLSKKMKLPLIVIGKQDLYRNVYKYAAEEKVTKFLSLIKYAQFVITNSFHGTAFSIIFKKSFITFAHTSKPARMVDLLNQIGLEDRLVRELSQIKDPEFHIDISYSRKTADTLHTSTAFSKEYLSEAIEQVHIKQNCVTGHICSGCTLCAEICPKSAISIQLTDGYFHATADETKCIQCGLCTKLCPMNSIVQNHDLHLYAVKHHDNHVRNQSSSGGFFSAIAEHVIADRGVVYGVRYNEQSKSAVFDKSETLEKTYLFRKSKYVQAMVDDSLKEVEKDLKMGRKVLFTGTPCQIQALNTFLSYKKTDKRNLLTADVICHGTPSPAVLQSFISYLEEVYGKPIDQFVFRDKEQGWKGHGYRIVFSDGTSRFNDYYSMAWTKLFTLSINDACFQCPFACLSRVSDFTMGDFWGIEKSDCADLEDESGVSLVLVNTQKGNEFLKFLDKDCLIKPTAIEACKKNNPLFRPTFKPSRYDDFRSEFENRQFKYVISKYCYYKGIKSIQERIKWFVIYKTGMKSTFVKLFK